MGQSRQVRLPRCNPARRSAILCLKFGFTFRVRSSIGEHRVTIPGILGQNQSVALVPETKDLKVCSKCKVSKPRSEFSKDSCAKGGLKGRCRLCTSIANKAKRLANPQAAKERDRLKYAANSEAIKLNARTRRSAAIEEFRERDKERYRLNPEPAKTRSNNWKQRNQEKVNRDKKEWNRLNPDHRRRSRRKRNKTRYRTDVDFKIKVTLRNSLNRVLKTAGYSSIVDLGCTVPEFKTYMERLFKPGMTWKNHSRTGWHIDHIRPLSNFDSSDATQMKLACHYTNLQPLWAHENLSKGDTYTLQDASAIVPSCPKTSTSDSPPMAS